MSFVTVRGGEHCELRFDTRRNEHIARQLAEAMARHHLPAPRERRDHVEITMDQAIKAGVVQLVHFDWEQCELGNE